MQASRGNFIPNKAGILLVWDSDRFIRPTWKHWISDVNHALWCKFINVSQRDQREQKQAIFQQKLVNCLLVEKVSGERWHLVNMFMWFTLEAD